MKKEDDMDFFYLNKKNNKKNLKRKGAGRKPAQGTINKDDDKFNFENEIVIGVNSVRKIPDKKVQTKKSKNNKNRNRNQNENRTSTSNNRTKNRRVNKSKEKKKNRIKFIVKWFVLILLLTGAIIFFLLTPLFNISKIEVQNNQTISKEQIISLSKINVGENTFKINKNKVISNIKENPYIEDVQIKRSLPDKVNIIVKERTATFVLEFVDSYMKINNQGYMLEILTEAPNLPIIKGYETSIENIKLGNRLVNEDLKKMESVIKIMESAKSNEIDGFITGIDITDESDYIIIFADEGKKAHLGTTADINTKILYIKVVLEKEKGIEGDIFLEGDTNSKKAYFREKV